MKIKLFIAVGFWIIISNANAQIEDTSLGANNYKTDGELIQLKSQNQNTTAWGLLVGGTIVTAIGILHEINAKNVDDFTGSLNQVAEGAAIAFIGSLAMLTSVPYFIASVKNKWKAKLLLKNESVFFNPQLSLTHMLALGVKIKL